MADIAHAHKWVVLLVLALVLMHAFSSAASVLVWALLAPFWLFFFDAFISVRLSARRDDAEVGSFPFFPVPSSRAPLIAY